MQNGQTTDGKQMLGGQMTGATMMEMKLGCMPHHGMDLAVFLLQ